MLAEVKKCVDNLDIKGIRYIFVDCLDVDPTFEKYKADYEFCKRIEGVLEPYTELTPMIQDEAYWNKQYWEQLKIDLMKNFSSKRFEHMVKVAKVVYVDKISRLLKERQNEQSSIILPQEIPPAAIKSEKLDSKVPSKAPSKSEIQKKQLEERRRKIELENQKIEVEQRKQKEKIEAAKREEEEERRRKAEKHGRSKKDNTSKKWMGIALVVVVVVILVIFAINIMQM